MQSPDPPFALGQEIGVGTSLEVEPAGDAVCRESTVRIAVPRIVRPMQRGDAPFAMKARLLAVATEHLRRLGPHHLTVKAVAAELGVRVR